jgi:hypothetical protein
MEKAKRNSIDYCEHDTLKVEKQISTVARGQSDGIKLELILDSRFESAEQKSSLLPMKVTKLPDSCEAKRDRLTEVDRQNKETDYRLEKIDKELECNADVLGILLIPAKDRDHSDIQMIDPIVRTAQVKGEEDNSVCLRKCSSAADLNMFHGKDFNAESRLAQKKLEDGNTSTCNYVNIMNCNDQNVSKDNYALNLRSFPSENLDSCLVKNMSKSQSIVSQENKNRRSMKQNSKALVIDNKAIAADMVSSQRPTSPHVPDDFKPECHLDDSYTKVMAKDACYLIVRNGESAEFPNNNEASISVTQNTALWACESPKGAQCKIHNERDQQDVESPTVFICDMTALDCHEKN